MSSHMSAEEYIAVMHQDHQALRAENERLRALGKEVAHDAQTLSQNNMDLRKENERLREALEFYADPDTYFAIGFFPDPPMWRFYG